MSVDLYDDVVWGEFDVLCPNPDWDTSEPVPDAERPVVDDGAYDHEVAR